MKSITVAQLRQNPTSALNAVEAGETYEVTRHNRPIAHLVPVEPRPTLRIRRAPARGRADLSDLEPWNLTTAGSVDELLDDMDSER